MSLGIERTIGDIIVADDIQFVLTERLESYIMFELNRIKGATVKLILFYKRYDTIKRELENSKHVSAMRLTLY